MVAGRRDSLTVPRSRRRLNVSTNVAHSTMNLRGGRRLPDALRSSYEDRFGYDLNHVRMHTGTEAEKLASGLDALAFTIGPHVVFGKGQFNPNTTRGGQLLAHELVHVVQQGEGRAEHVVQRASPADCSPDCAAPDGTVTASGTFSVTVYADKEGPFLLIPFTAGVGHSWLRLEDDRGKYWTYGYWPESGFDPNHPTKDVNGCVHHPDTSHKPTASQRIELSAQEFALAHAKAQEICVSKPKYNLFGLQCTEFVRRILAAAGKAPSLGFGLIWESPNALDSWLRSHSLLLGALYTPWASSGAGGLALDFSYRHQLFSLLGNRLRAYATARGELGGQFKTVTLGAGVTLDPGRVWLPNPYLEAGGVAGGFPSGAGAGGSLATGLRYNIDELAVVGIEYNIIRDATREDPATRRLMLQLGLRLW